MAFRNQLVPILTLIAFFVLATFAWSDPSPQFDPFTFALLNEHQDQDCSLGFCEALNDIGPPPDTILHLPPPPLPPQFAHLIQNNPLTENNSTGCSFCEQFVGGLNTVQAESGSSEPSLNRTQTDHESWLSLLVASILASSVLGTVCILLLARCRHWQPFQLANCPLLPSKFLGGSVSSNKTPPACRSPSDDGCVSPVVNEKSPQCIISNSPCKRSTIIPAKYWRTSRCPIDLHSPSQQTPLEQSASTTELDEYTGCGESGSCTSSPVYAELDAHQQITQMLQHQLAQQQQQHCSQINTTQLGQSIQFGTASVLNAYADPISATHCPGQARSTCTQIRLSGASTPAPNIHHQQTLQQQPQNNAYSVHTYTELPEPVRINRFGPNTALLPDVSYDNAAYLPSSVGDTHQYQNRSLRRHRAVNIGQLGSATPLLSSHYGNTMHPQFMTAGRNSNNKKQRGGGFLLQSNQQSAGGSRLNLNGAGTMISLRSDSVDAESLDLQPRYVQTSGRGRIVHEVYNDASIGDSSPSINSFRTLSYKEQPKRPLPPVPGVRL